MSKLLESMNKKFNKMLKEQIVKEIKKLVEKRIIKLTKKGKLEEAKKLTSLLKEGVFFNDPESFEKLIDQYSNLFSDNDEELKNRNKVVTSLNKEIEDVNGAAIEASEPKIKKDKLTAGGKVF